MTRLELPGCYISDAFVHALVDGCTSLKFIDFSYTNVTLASVGVIVEHCKVLEGLDMAACLSSDHMDDIIANAKAENQLKDFEAADWTHDSQEEHDEIKSTTDMLQCVQVIDDGVVKINDGIQGPEMISIENNSKVLDLSGFQSSIEEDRVGSDLDEFPIIINTIQQGEESIRSIILPTENRIGIDNRKEPTVRPILKITRVTDIPNTAILKDDDERSTSDTPYHDRDEPLHRPYLKTLSLAFSSATDTLISSIVQACSSLTIVDISNTLISDSALSYIAQHCCRLEDLNVSECNISDVGIQSILIHLTQILMVATTSYRSLQQFEHIPPAKRVMLKTLDVRGCKRVSSRVLVMLAEGCPVLEKVFVEECDEILALWGADKIYLTRDEILARQCDI